MTGLEIEAIKAWLATQPCTEVAVMATVFTLVLRYLWDGLKDAMKAEDDEK